MCLQYQRVKKVNVNGVSYVYHKCGKCADCRREEQKAWETRLRIEFNDLKSRGWNVGFITLTYSPDCLPTIPEECFKNADQYREIPCFDQDTVRQWIKSIRQYCKYHYNFKNGDNIRYMVVSEYGEHTHRPHYHALLAWPSACDYRTMHALCDHYWSKGRVGPSHYLGDSSCKHPFEVQGDTAAVISYIAKYVSKDISYVEQVKDIDFYTDVKNQEKDTDEYWKARRYNNCRPFHIQSVSLGYEPIKRMSDDDKLSLIKDGLCFIGDDKTYQVPLYIKNKLMYNPYYVIDENGKRLVRRQASAFFEANREEFFNKKAEFYNKYISQVNRGFLESAGVEKDIVDKAMDVLNYYYDRVNKNVPVEILGNMGAYYLAYNGIQSDRCFDIPLVEQYMLRYRKPENVEVAYVEEKWPLFDGYVLSWLHPLWNFINSLYFYVNRVGIAEREEKEKLNKKILNYWNEVVK